MAGDVSAPSPAAPSDTNQTDQAGVPVYPGSSKVGAAVSPQSGGETHFSEIVQTDDSPAKVFQFYKTKLGFEGGAKDESYQLVGRTKSGADVLIFIEPDNGATKITVRGILHSSGGSR